MNKKILVLTGYPFSEVVIANRISPIFKAFRERGLSVELITYATKENAENVTKQYNAPTVPYKLPASILRLLAEILNFFFLNVCLQIKIRSKSNQTSLVFITVPSMFLIFCALPQKGSIKYICDIRDITWEYILNNRASFVPRTIRKIFIRALHRYDYISVTNHAEFTYLLSQGIPKEKLYILHNGIGEDKFFELRDRVAPKLSSRVNKFLYSGNVGKAQNLDFLIDIFLYAGTNASLEIVGHGVCLELLKKKCEIHKSDNVHFYGFLPWLDMVDKYYTADVLVVSLGPEYKSAVPSKIFEYLTMRKLILYIGPKGACSRVLSQFENVFFVDIDSANAKEALAKIANNPSSLLTEINPNGFERNIKKIEKKFIRDQNCARFADTLFR